MSKNAFARGTLTFNLVATGVFDVSLDFTWSEHDTTDTLSTVTESEFVGGKEVITVTFSLWKNAGSADLILNRTTVATTSGSLVVGIAYRITDFQAGDNFTDVAGTTGTTGLEFIAIGTTPNVWTNSSILNTMVECTLKVEDASGNYTTYEGDLTLLNKQITGSIDGMVQVTYTGKISGALEEAQG